jgi:hypothetical protein
MAAREGHRVVPPTTREAAPFGLNDERSHDATDGKNRDTVLITAAFCMYNWYVDGLGTRAPDHPAAYDEAGAMLDTRGYLR